MHAAPFVRPTFRGRGAFQGDIGLGSRKSLPAPPHRDISCWRSRGARTFGAGLCSPGGLELRWATTPTLAFTGHKRSLAWPPAAGGRKRGGSEARGRRCLKTQTEAGVAAAGHRGAESGASARRVRVPGSPERLRCSPFSAGSVFWGLFGVQLGCPVQAGALLPAPWRAVSVRIQCP